jgi:hypothetical protein
MNEERSLLPWILGGLSAAAIAVAFAAVSSYRDVPTSPQPVVAAHPPTAPTTPPVSAAAQALPPAAVPAVIAAAPISSPAPAQVAVEPAAPDGQIWECTTKGVKTFSNNPCGEKSTLLQVGPINTMRATPAVHYMGGPSPQPRYTAGSADPSDTGDDYSDQNAGAGDSYTIVQGVRVVRRRRPEHFHTPYAHHNGGHNSGPVRRN